MITNESILVYRGLRYFRWALVLVIVCAIAYGFHKPIPAPNGGTWLGYTLGTIGALLIVWLLWFGVRKRRYGGGKIRLEDWLSAHVYLGIALIVVATLHTGFQFGWNVHTLAYTLMMIVIFSGMFGVYVYIRYPKIMTDNRRGMTLQAMMTQISELDTDARKAALRLGDEINKLVLDASENTRIGGSMMRQLSGRAPGCPAVAAPDRVRTLLGKAETTGAGRDAEQLIALLQRKSELVQRARRDVQIKAMMDIWLYIHVPLSVALIGALIAHIVSVFFYW
jgi:hypothetical protein